MTLKKPTKKTMRVYDLMEIVEFVEKKYKIDLYSTDGGTKRRPGHPSGRGPQGQSFWQWFCDHGLRGKGNDSLGYIPIGYWGWDDNDLPIVPEDPEERFIHECLEMFRKEFAPRSDELRFHANW